MTGHVWSLDARHGELCVSTDVTGRAARMGHRLVIAAQRWQATVGLAGDVPTAAELTVAVDSLQVVRGEGGIKGLSESEKELARSNALESFEPGRFPEIRFGADTIAGTDTGYRLTGSLRIRDVTRTQVVDLDTHETADAWRLSTTVPVRQSDFGIRPRSMFMGSVRVADTVTITFRASRNKAT